jgi:hypothetical protein
VRRQRTPHVDLRTDGVAVMDEEQVQSYGAEWPGGCG